MALSGQTIKKYSPSEAFWVWVEWTAVQDVANNRTTITAITYGGSNSYGYYSGSNKWGYTTIDGITTSVKYTAPWAAGTAKKELHRQTRTVNHNDEGLKTVTISGKWTAGSDPEGSFFSLLSSGSFELDPIPRASQPTTNYSGQSLGYAIQIRTNRASTTFTHKLKYSIGALSGTIAAGVGDTYTWTLPVELAAAITTSKSGVLKIICETYSGTTLVGTKEISITVGVPDNETFRPDPSITSIIEAATGLSAFTVFIQGKSKIKVDVAATGKYGATITQYHVEIDGSSYYGQSITSPVINKAGQIPVKLTVTDSRGYSDSVTQNVTVEPYQPPKIANFSAGRAPTDQGTDLSAAVNFSVSPVANQNTKRYLIRYRPAGGSWTVLIDSSAYYARATTHTAAGVLNPDLSYEVELTVVDAFASAVKTVLVPSAFELLNFHASGRAMAIGKVSEIQDALEIALPIYIGGIRSYMVTDSGSNASGSYIKLGDGTMICWGAVDYTIPDMTQIGGVWGHTSTAMAAVAFPVAFATSPVINLSTNIGEALNCALRDFTLASFTWRLYTTVPMTAGQTKKLYYQAIGRWKL